MISTAVALGTMSGPILGGWVIEWLDWRFLFLIHVPIAFICIGLSFKYIPHVIKKKEGTGISVINYILFVSFR